MADKAIKGSGKQDQQKAQKPQRSPASIAPANDVGGPSAAGIAQRLSQGRAAITPADVIVLNRTVGMRRAMRLIDQNTTGSSTDLTTPGGSPQRILARRGITIQPKLTVGAADDAYEQEADATAERVMRMSNAPDAPAAQGVTPLRTDDESVQTVRDAATDAFDAGSDFEQHLSDTGSGAPLPARTRAFMEPRFGADFGKVRLHTGGSAMKLNRAISAQAFTHGHDIYLGKGKNDLDTVAGKRLLAHELTHTIQQGAAPLQRSTLRRSFNHNSTDIIQRVGNDEVKIEEVEDEDESPRKWEPPKEIVQPAVPLMLADAPWSEVEAREGRERKERSQLEDPRYQNKLKEIGPQAPQNVGKLGALNSTLKEHFQQRDPRYQNKLGEIGGTRSTSGTKLSDETLGNSNQMLKEQFQQRDPRYQNKLGEIGGTRSTSGTKLGQQTIGDSNQMLKEQVQQRDPRYQKRLAEMNPQVKPGTLPENRKQGLQDAFAQDKVNQNERRLEVLRKEEEARKLVELQSAKLAMETTSAAAKLKYDALEPADLDVIKIDTQNVKMLQAWQEEKKKGNTSLGYYKSKLAWAQYVLEWTTKRISRRSLLKRLKDEIATIKVVGRFKVAFVAQATAKHTRITSGVLTADREGVNGLMADFRNTLTELAADHKKVNDLDQKGGKYGQRSVRDLLPAVDAVISKVDFDVVADRPALDEAIKAFDEAHKILSNNDQTRMKDAQKAENKLTDHSTTGQDARGKTEETEALVKINELFTKTQLDVKGREGRITNSETEALVSTTNTLNSYSDRVKETAAHDLKAKYEAAPYYLDSQVSKIVHEERHIIKGSSGYKSKVQIEQDYKDEVDKQYEATKEAWCKYLGYTNGNGAARVTNNVGAYGGAVGHNSVFLGNYAAIVMAKDAKASLPAAVEKTTDELMDILYPSAGTAGAHFTLEFPPEPKPHAYRGGDTRPGTKYQADYNAGNVTWTNAENHMVTQQQNEEVRVRGLIQAAVTSHMTIMHRRNPDRRKAA